MLVFTFFTIRCASFIAIFRRLASYTEITSPPQHDWKTFIDYNEQNHQFKKMLLLEDDINANDSIEYEEACSSDESYSDSSGKPFLQESFKFNLITFPFLDSIFSSHLPSKRTPKKQTSASPPRPSQPPPSLYYNCAPTESALKRLSFHFSVILARHLRLLQLSGPKVSFTFGPGSSYGRSKIVKGLKDAISETDKKLQSVRHFHNDFVKGLSFTREKLNAPSPDSVIIINNSQRERAIYSRLAISCPSWFPRAYSIEECMESGLFEYKFEAIEPLVITAPNGSWKLTPRLVSSEDLLEFMRLGVALCFGYPGWCTCHA